MAVVLNEGYSCTNKEKYLSKAEGCRVWDLQGNAYVDMAMAGGSAILGHADKSIVEAASSQFAAGSLFTSPSILAHQFCEVIGPCLAPLSEFVFSSTGSEATLRAIRIARAATGKEKIAIFSGCWHGSHDLLLVEDDPKSDQQKPEAILKSAGTTRDVLNQVIVLPYNDPSAFKLIKDHAQEIAMVFIEPAQGSNPRADIRDFLLGLRKVCTENNVLLGFDEIITGGRLALGGGKTHFEINPDIATFGKIYGGGLPLGLTAGTTEVMACIRSENPVFLGGTFSANPISLAAGLCAIEQLRERPETYVQLSRRASDFVAEINGFAQTKGIDAHMMGVGSMFRLILSSNTVSCRRERDRVEPAIDIQNTFYQHLRAAGVWIGTNRINFLSTSHDDAALALAQEAYQSSLLRFAADL
ncbi:MAG: aspartate aminotransferase family protein [Candidatus Azotimanducaceae bacterium]